MKRFLEVLVFIVALMTVILFAWDQSERKFYCFSNHNCLKSRVNFIDLCFSDHFDVVYPLLFIAFYKADGITELTAS